MKKYCIDMKVYPMDCVLKIIQNYIDPRASVQGKKRITYSIKMNGKWRKKELSLTDCVRIFGEINHAFSD